MVVKEQNSDRRAIFMTGFPGFIAARLLRRLARPDFDVYLLVQPHFVEAAEAEVKRIAGAASTPEANFALVPGDITKSDLGIEPDDLAEILERTTDVFHLAAIYDLEVTKETAKRVNVDGTRHVNELCRRMKSLRRYNYVSTCYVAGNRTGLILETELVHSAGFRNHYEETKYLAELSVEQTKPEIPLTIYRPSVVVGDSETGETAKYDGIYSLIHYLQMGPKLLRLVNVGNDRVRLNLVPVDFVVDAIAVLSDDHAAEGETVAIADPRPLTTAELFDTLADEMTGKTSAIKPPAGLVEAFLKSPISPPLTGLPHSGVPYFFIEQSYDASIADRLLEPHGVQCPDFRDYAGNLIDFVRKHPRLRQLHRSLKEGE